MTADFRPLRILGAWLLGVWLTLATIVAVLLFGPLVEARLLPVWSMVSVEWEPSAAGLVVRPFGYRNRPQCRFLQATTLVRDRDVWHRADLTIDGRPQRGVTRPEGWQSLGRWELSRSGDRLRITALFSCHDLWDTPATLGEWPAPGGK